MFRAALTVLVPSVVKKNIPRHVIQTVKFSSSSSASTLNRIGIIGASFEKGQRRVGVSAGPQVIRDTGVLNDLKNLDLDVKDFGDIKQKDNNNNNTSTKEEEVQLGPNGERHHSQVLEYSRRLATSVCNVVKEGRVCVTLGGDHSIAIGTINGHAAARPEHQLVVLWVDAHADLNTGTISPSGNMHGMPLTFHLSNMEKNINKLPDGWPRPCINPHNLVYIGLRDVDPCESSLMEQMGILSFGMREVEHLGLMGALTAALNHLRPSPTRPIHLSFDIDALDPSEAPSTGTPVRGGLTLREGLSLCEEVRQTGYLSALDLVEVNPSLGTPDDAKRTANAARLLLLSALAARRTS